MFHQRLEVCRYLEAADKQRHVGPFIRPRRQRLALSSITQSVADGVFHSRAHKHIRRHICSILLQTWDMLHVDFCSSSLETLPAARANVSSMVETMFPESISIFYLESSSMPYASA